MNTIRAIPLIALAWCTAAPAQILDGGCKVESGARTLPLVELYTSEGCDSCPPADRWLSRTFPATGPARAGVLAFHVDYWDRLGWPDRFAKHEWSQRQQDLARATRSASVYTPQLTLQGRDLDALRGGDGAGEIGKAADAPARATIALRAVRERGRIVVSATAQVPQAPDRAGARIVVAYTDSGHVTDVKRGENRGVTLSHDHVVRALAKGGSADSSGAMSLAATLPVPEESGKLPRIVAFVERETTREVLQSLELPLDLCGR
ncbi:MAG: DUF1223 domain-containing protein [Betaproteobacteria bacterium]